jgi:thioredoxin-related protein
MFERRPVYVLKLPPSGSCCLVLLAILIVFAALPSSAANALELVMFGRPGCVWCARWEREVAPSYPRAEIGRLAPVRRMDIRDQRRSGIALGEPVIYTPTFVLSDNGVEIGRITGYQNQDMFWGTLDSLLQQGRGDDR